METLSTVNLQTFTNIILRLQMMGQLAQCVLILFNNIVVLKTHNVICQNHGPLR